MKTLRGVFYFIALVTAFAFSEACAPADFWTAQTQQEQAVVVDPPENLVLVPILGQSNASGRGSLVGAPASLTTPHTDVLGDVDIVNFANDYQWHEAVEPIDSGANYVDATSNDGASAGVGPAMAFALEYVALHPGARVGLIPCAKGSTTIHEWRRQSLVDSTLTPIRSNLYGSCLHRIHTALAEAPGSVLGGVLFWQGESDARPSTVYAQPTTYAWQLIRWVKVLRADLDMHELPFIYARLAATPSDASLTAWGTVKEQQSLARYGLDFVGMIETEDLALAADGLHLTTASQVVVGARFAQALTAVENQQ